MALTHKYYPFGDFVVDRLLHYGADPSIPSARDVLLTSNPYFKRNDLDAITIRKHDFHSLFKVADIERRLLPSVDPTHEYGVDCRNLMALFCMLPVDLRCFIVGFLAQAPCVTRGTNEFHGINPKHAPRVYRRLINRPDWYVPGAVKSISAISNQEKFRNSKLVEIKQAVKEAVHDYLEFHKDMSKDNRGENTGLFARVRHGKAGRERAENFNLIIEAAQNPHEMITAIIDLLDDPKTKFHNHSFATYY